MLPFRVPGPDEEAATAIHPAHQVQRTDVEVDPEMMTGVYHPSGKTLKEILFTTTTVTGPSGKAVPVYLRKPDRRMPSGMQAPFLRGSDDRMIGIYTGDQRYLDQPLSYRRGKNTINRWGKLQRSASVRGLGDVGQRIAKTGSEDMMRAGVKDFVRGMMQDSSSKRIGGKRTGLAASVPIQASIAQKITELEEDELQEANALIFGGDQLNRIPLSALPATDMRNRVGEMHATEGEDVGPEKRDILMRIDEKELVYDYGVGDSYNDEVLPSSAQERPPMANARPERKRKIYTGDLQFGEDFDERDRAPKASRRAERKRKILTGDLQFGEDFEDRDRAPKASRRAERKRKILTGDLQFGEDFEDRDRAPKASLRAERKRKILTGDLQFGEDLEDRDRAPRASLRAERRQPLYAGDTQFGDMPEERDQGPVAYARPEAHKAFVFIEGMRSGQASEEPALGDEDARNAYNFTLERQEKAIQRTTEQRIAAASRAEDVLGQATRQNALNPDAVEQLERNKTIFGDYDRSYKLLTGPHSEWARQKMTRDEAYAPYVAMINHARTLRPLEASDAVDGETDYDSEA